MKNNNNFTKLKGEIKTVQAELENLRKELIAMQTALSVLQGEMASVHVKQVGRQYLTKKNQKPKAWLTRLREQTSN